MPRGKGGGPVLPKEGGRITSSYSFCRMCGDREKDLFQIYGTVLCAACREKKRKELTSKGEKDREYESALRKHMGLDSGKVYPDHLRKAKERGKKKEDEKLEEMRRRYLSDTVTRLREGGGYT